ncbi:unnamed protein product [Microthlaspi erraticum]|uniref:Uncharacterized protein n=1 Tax=Microthlaspi erraticum TaxID=1685480 RepID=A0A6D2KK59_9BRAS|nr:unnamed protein product [Microthlaspi erraticum]
MATKFTILSQVNRPKTSTLTRKAPRSTRNKPHQSKSTSENMLNNVFADKTRTEIYHNNLNSHSLTDSLLPVEDPSVKEEETSQQEQWKMSNCNRKDGKFISDANYGDLRRDVARLSLLWYMKCSISYILRRARAFYNEFCCDTHVQSSTTFVVDPYFSVPVLPVNN